MPDIIQPNASMVNYTSVLTSASNEIYVCSTVSPESLASLIKNNVLIQFNLMPEEQKKTSDLESTRTDFN